MQEDSHPNAQNLEKKNHANECGLWNKSWKIIIVVMHFFIFGIPAKIVVVLFQFL